MLVLHCVHFGVGDKVLLQLLTNLIGAFIWVTSAETPRDISLAARKLHEALNTVHTSLADEVAFPSVPHLCHILRGLALLFSTALRDTRTRG